METILLYIAAVCFGLSFLIVFVAWVYSFLCKRNQKKKQEEQNKKVADEVTRIYVNSALIRFKLSGLERQTQWLNERNELRKAEEEKNEKDAST